MNLYISKAIKYGIWTSTPKSNDFLKKVYEECTPKKIPIFLFYRYDAIEYPSLNFLKRSEKRSVCRRGPDDLQHHR